VKRKFAFSFYDTIRLCCDSGGRRRNARGAARETNEAAAQDLAQAENARKRIGEGEAGAIQGTKADASVIGGQARPMRPPVTGAVTRRGPPRSGKRHLISPQIENPQILGLNPQSQTRKFLRYARPQNLKSANFFD
jgi:hypothetical protein